MQTKLPLQRAGYREEGRNEEKTTLDGLGHGLLNKCILLIAMWPEAGTLDAIKQM